VVAIDLVLHCWFAIFTEEHWAFDFLICLFPFFNLKSNCLQIISENR